MSKVLVHNCSEYTTCNGCVEAGDPYCGWCSLQNKYVSRITLMYVQGCVEVVSTIAVKF